MDSEKVKQKVKEESKKFWQQGIEYTMTKPRIVLPFALFGLINLVYWIGRIF